MSRFFRVRVNRRIRDVAFGLWRRIAPLREWALRYTQSQSDVRAQTSAPIHPIRSSQGMRLELGLTAFRPGFLVASPPFGVLLLCAEHLFVAASVRDPQPAADLSRRGGQGWG